MTLSFNSKTKININFIRGITELTAMSLYLHLTLNSVFSAILLQNMAGKVFNQVKELILYYENDKFDSNEARAVAIIFPNQKLLKISQRRGEIDK